ncbi:hypothetical protein GCM10023188_33960 [Pontibacter saemangeumensis]|uniref:Uncharacterized protein n=1 Tax=Pontibacter saemangeumensis TaxID=1084525 RepID=A0ABP8LXU6_9BACT
MLLAAPGKASRQRLQVKQLHRVGKAGINAALIPEEQVKIVKTDKGGVAQQARQEVRPPAKLTCGATCTHR